MAVSVPQASVQIETVDMSSQVQSIDVEDHDRAVDRARVVFDGADDVSAIVREQCRVSINMGWSDQNALMFQGVVMGVKTEAAGTGPARVTLTAYDLSYKMKQNQTKDRRFLSGKLSDALTAIVGDYPDLQVGTIAPNPDPVFTPASPWGKPNGMSDLDFIQQAAIVWNSRCFVEVNDNQSQFYFVTVPSLLKGDPMGVLQYLPSGVGDLLEFKYQRVGSAASPIESTTVIDPKTGDPVTQQDPPPPPEAPLQVGPSANATVSQAGGIMAQAAGQPADSRPNTVVAGAASDPNRIIQQDPTLVLGYYGRGVCRGTIMLRAKGKVTIKGFPPWVEGDWYVNKVNHIYTRLSISDKHRQPADRSTYLTKFSVTR